MDIRGIIANLAPVASVLAWMLLAYLILLWAASVLWTYRDIHSRSEDVAVQVLAVVLALVLPFGGVVLHLIFARARRWRKNTNECSKKSICAAVSKTLMSARRVSDPLSRILFSAPIVRRRCAAAALRVTA